MNKKKKTKQSAGGYEGQNSSTSIEIAMNEMV